MSSKYWVRTDWIVISITLHCLTDGFDSTFVSKYFLRIFDMLLQKTGLNSHTSETVFYEILNDITVLHRALFLTLHS